MDSIKISFWDRTFDLDVIYQNYPGEGITETEKQTVAQISEIDFSDSLPFVCQYIQEDLMFQGLNYKIDNIFDCIKPECVVVINKPENRTFAIMCDYSFDEEHGLSIVYENEKYKAVGSQSMIL